MGAQAPGERLADLQARIAAKRAERGFTPDNPLKLHLMLSEEVGEVARELKRSVSVNYEAFDAGRLANEVADVFVVLSALSTHFDIDMETAVEAKFFGADEARTWRSSTLRGANGPGRDEDSP